MSRRKNRNYQAEYRRRIQHGVDRGLTRSEARGHGARVSKRRELPLGTPLWDAYREFQSSKNLSAAARAKGVAPERLRELIKSRGLATRDGRRWISTDRLPRRVLIYSRGKKREITVGDYENAALAGAYWHARGKLLDTNDPIHLAPFVGRSVTDFRGQPHSLETDPNAVYRLAAAGGPAFEEIYRIIV